MMVREDLISSAVSFLQDPSVAASPLEKRKAFLKSKNLTQEEIDLALARAKEDTSSWNAGAVAAPNQTEHGYSNPPITRPPASPNAYSYGYGSYQGGPWGQIPPPPELAYPFTKCSVAYLTSADHPGETGETAPPTPPQLEQDKAEIDASFSRAFALIDQLATDTSAIKSAETERTEKLDTALREVESVVSELKTASKRREEDGRRIADEVRALKDLIPKALEGWKADGDGKLKELGSELNSLKKLVGNRVGSGSSQVPIGRPYGSVYSERAGGISGGTPKDPVASGSQPSISSMGEKPEDSATNTPTLASAPGVNVPKRDSSSSFNFASRPSGRAAIPAWQMAAAESKDKSSKGSAVPNIDAATEEAEPSTDA
ncbi:MAG: hypothetical protein Q9187_006366 [Circinaria calcarea]